MKIPVIETKQTRLRPFCEADIDALFHITNQKDIFRYFPNSAPWTREKAEKFIASQLAH